MVKSHLVKEKKSESILISKIDIFKAEIEIYSNLFAQANLELKIVKESSEILDLDRLKLIFGEVNIKKEGLIMNAYELSFEEYQEIEQHLANKFSELTGIEKRALAELKAGILNAKNDNFII